MGSRTSGVVIFALAMSSAALTGSLLSGGLPPATAASGSGGVASTIHTPGNGRIAFSTTRPGNQDIFVMYQDGSGQKNLTNSSTAAEFAAAWSADGAKIAYTKKAGGDRDVWVMSPDGSGKKNLTQHAGSVDTQPSWSPDGGKIAFSSDRDGTYDIWIMNADGSGQTSLESNAGSDTKPAWSPDGTTIAFMSDRTGDKEIWVMNADGSGTPANLTDTPGFDDDYPSWSSDGTRIAFSTNRNGAEDVYVMNPDGSGQSNLTAGLAGSNSDPAFAPDSGARVIYMSGTNPAQVKSVNLTPTNTPFGDRANLTHDSKVASWPAWQPLPAPVPNGSPIQHVVILFQENHSFDNALGLMCVDDGRCNGATSGKLHDGTTRNLTKAADLIPNIDHSPDGQIKAVNGGKMNQFDLLKGCTKTDGYDCYTQFHTDQIPNLVDLARTYALSDRTFENDLIASWVSHLQVVTAFDDGFIGKNPEPAPGEPEGPGWGCDSNREARWQPSALDDWINVPSCIPQQDGTGPFRDSSVPWSSTIMHRMDEAGLSWGLYVPTESMSGYTRAICPSLADCIYGGQAENVYPPFQFQDDIAAGRMPALSILSPSGPNSQHNDWSMAQGDNWIGDIVSAVVDSQYWSSTAIFLTYDDCGCFYDHVAPPVDLGIRVPMVIVSPFAKAGYTDTKTASYAGMLAYVEHTFGLAPMSSEDADAYDFNKSFDYSQRPLPGISMKTTKVPQWELDYIESHPPDDDDPT